MRIDLQFLHVYRNVSYSMALESLLGPSINVVGFDMTCLNPLSNDEQARRCNHLIYALNTRGESENANHAIDRDLM